MWRIVLPVPVCSKSQHSGAQLMGSSNCQGCKHKRAVHSMPIDLLSLQVFLCPICVLCCWAPTERKNMRLALDLRSECCNDWCVWLLCPVCATCEEARELRFRHVGSTEEFVDKSQEIRVKKWGTGMKVNFKEGDRVIHPHRGHGTVILIMPDTRRVVKYDSGTVYYYSPGKTQWKFRLEKVTSK